MNDYSNSNNHCIMNQIPLLEHHFYKIVYCNECQQENICESCYQTCHNHSKIKSKEIDYQTNIIETHCSCAIKNHNYEVKEQPTGTLKEDDQENCPMNHFLIQLETKYIYKKINNDTICLFCIFNCEKSANLDNYNRIASDTYIANYNIYIAKLNESVEEVNLRKRPQENLIEINPIRSSNELFDFELLNEVDCQCKAIHNKRSILFMFQNCLVTKKFSEYIKQENLFSLILKPIYKLFFFWSIEHTHTKLEIAVDNNNYSKYHNVSNNNSIYSVSLDLLLCIANLNTDKYYINSIMKLCNINFILKLLSTKIVLNDNLFKIKYSVLRIYRKLILKPCLRLEDLFNLNLDDNLSTFHRSLFSFDSNILKNYDITEDKLIKILHMINRNCIDYLNIREKQEMYEIIKEYLEWCFIILNLDYDLFLKNVIEDMINFVLLIKFTPEYSKLTHLYEKLYILYMKKSRDASIIGTYKLNLMNILNKERGIEEDNEVLLNKEENEPSFSINNHDFKNIKFHITFFKSLFCFDNRKHYLLSNSFYDLEVKKNDIFIKPLANYLINDNIMTIEDILNYSQSLSSLNDSFYLRSFLSKESQIILENFNSKLQNYYYNKSINNTELLLNYRKISNILDETNGKKFYLIQIYLFKIGVFSNFLLILENMHKNEDYESSFNLILNYLQLITKNNSFLTTMLFSEQAIQILFKHNYLVYNSILDTMSKTIKFDISYFTKKLFNVLNEKHIKDNYIVITLDANLLDRLTLLNKITSHDNSSTYIDNMITVVTLVITSESYLSLISDLICDLNTIFENSKIKMCDEIKENMIDYSKYNQRCCLLKEIYKFINGLEDISKIKKYINLEHIEMILLYFKELPLRLRIELFKIYKRILIIDYYNRKPKESIDEVKGSTIMKCMENNIIGSFKENTKKDELLTTGNLIGLKVHFNKQTVLNMIKSEQGIAAFYIIFQKYIQLNKENKKKTIDKKQSKLEDTQIEDKQIIEIKQSLIMEESSESSCHDNDNFGDLFFEEDNENNVRKSIKASNKGLIKIPYKKQKEMKLNNLLDQIIDLSPNNKEGKKSNISKIHVNKENKPVLNIIDNKENKVAVNKVTHKFTSPESNFTFRLNRTKTKHNRSNSIDSIFNVDSTDLVLNKGLNEEVISPSNKVTDFKEKSLIVDNTYLTFYGYNVISNAMIKFKFFYYHFISEFTSLNENIYIVQFFKETILEPFHYGIFKILIFSNNSLQFTYIIFKLIVLFLLCYDFLLSITKEDYIKYRLKLKTIFKAELRIKFDHENSFLDFIKTERESAESSLKRLNEMSVLSLDSIIEIFIKIKDRFDINNKEDMTIELIHKDKILSEILVLYKNSKDCNVLTEFIRNFKQSDLNDIVIKNLVSDIYEKIIPNHNNIYFLSIINNLTYHNTSVIHSTMLSIPNIQLRISNILIDQLFNQSECLFNSLFNLKNVQYKDINEYIDFINLLLNESNVYYQYLITSLPMTKEVRIIDFLLLQCCKILDMIDFHHNNKYIKLFLKNYNNLFPAFNNINQLLCNIIDNSSKLVLDSYFKSYYLKLYIEKINKFITNCSIKLTGNEYFMNSIIKLITFTIKSSTIHKDIIINNINCSSLWSIGTELFNSLTLEYLNIKVLRENDHLELIKEYKKHSEYMMNIKFILLSNISLYFKYLEYWKNYEYALLLKDNEFLKELIKEEVDEYEELKKINIINETEELTIRKLKTIILLNREYTYYINMITQSIELKHISNNFMQDNSNDKYCKYLRSFFQDKTHLDDISNLSNIEKISNNYKIIYFTIHPLSLYLDKKDEEELLSRGKYDSVLSNLNFLFDFYKEIKKKIFFKQYIESLSNNTYYYLFTIKNFETANRISSIFTCLINIFILLTFYKTETGHALSTFPNIFYLLIITHQIYLVYIIYIHLNTETLKNYIAERSEIYQKLTSNTTKSKSDEEEVKEYNKINFLSNKKTYKIYNTAMFYLSCIKDDSVIIHWNAFWGLIGLLFSSLSICFVIQLFSVIHYSNTMRAILESVKQRYKQFLSVAFIILVLILLFSSIAVIFYSDNYFDSTKSIGECDTSISCFFYFITNGLRGGAGFDFENKSISDDNYLVEGLLEVAFYFTLILMLLSVINGIVVDAFQERNEKEHEIQETRKNNCYICFKHKSDMLKNGENYKNHVKDKHNALNYLQYFIGLELQNDNYSFDEKIVMKCIRESKVTMFPISFDN